MPARNRFPDGLRLEPHKAGVMQQRLRAATPPLSAIVALDQGAGGHADPVVVPGTRVFLGTPIAQPASSNAATIHSPVSGTVRDIVASETARGSGPAIVIDNDGSDARDPRVEAPDLESLDPAGLVETMRRAGIVGLGGAAFPTSTKLEAARARSVGHLVLNGAECEPWISCDDALMRERPADVAFGAQVLMRASGAARTTIAVEDDKPEAIAALHEALASLGDDRLQVMVLPASYPAGAERQLLAAVTGSEVPHDALPPSVGLLCQNVGTAAAVAAWARTGEPCIARIVTITGSGVARPANLEARIGTPIAALVADCGGYRGEPRRLVAGGSMTGVALPTDAVTLSKAMNCILVAADADLVAHGIEMPCMRCGDCASACPVGLLPQQLHRAVAAADIGLSARYGLADCIECGCCDYVCPSRIPLTARFRAARTAAHARDEDRQRADDARRRFEQRERRLAAQAEAERRAFEEARARARGDGSSGSAT
ncbi:MAG: electron transport complex subunit RsxC [Steroidobacteraceae bacterium]